MKLIAISGKKGAGKDWSAAYLQAVFFPRTLEYQNIRIDDNGHIIATRNYPNTLDEWKLFTSNTKLVFDEVIDFNYADLRFIAKIKPNWKYARRLALADPLKRHCVKFFNMSPSHLWGSDDLKNEGCGYMWENFPHHKDQQRGTGEMTYRQFMQSWGQLLRSMNENVWVEKLCVDLDNQFSSYPQSTCIITDLRYPNEVDNLRSHCKNKNVAFKAVRLTRSISDDNHISETALDDYKDFDHILDNRSMTFKEVAKEFDKLL